MRKSSGSSAFNYGYKRKKETKTTIRNDIVASNTVGCHVNNGLYEERCVTFLPFWLMCQ